MADKKAKAEAEAELKRQKDIEARKARLQANKPTPPSIIPGGPTLAKSKTTIPPP